MVETVAGVISVLVGVVVVDEVVHVSGFVGGGKSS